MTQKLLSSLTATLLVTTLGVSQSTHAESSLSHDSKASITPKKNLEIATGPIFEPDLSLTTEVVKVGEQPTSPSVSQTGESIAKVHSFEVQGRKAAILYVRNIPILKFLGSAAPANPSQIKVGTQVTASPSDSTPDTSAKALDNIAPPKVNQASAAQPIAMLSVEALSSQSDNVDEPTWQASEVAARMNQLSRNGIDANKISVSWDKQSPKGRDRYLITLDNQVLATVTNQVRLPDKTGNLAEDALQITNRLRRTLGDAKPLTEVSGMPKPTQQVVAVGPIRLRLNGWASWYGPGFHGNPSASGERFNEHALTAAHRSLPFGTRVQVTNMDNGRTVVVRINDRGPFHGNRIIDLSTAAARILGVIQTGVAPVRLDVIDNRGVPVSSR